MGLGCSGDPAWELGIDSYDGCWPGGEVTPQGFRARRCTVHVAGTVPLTSVPSSCVWGARRLLGAESRAAGFGLHFCLLVTLLSCFYGCIITSVSESLLLEHVIGVTVVSRRRDGGKGSVCWVYWKKPLEAYVRVGWRLFLGA